MGEKFLSKVIVITGAGTGLGRALARRFVADGDNVVLLGRTLGKLEALAAELGEKSTAVQCDVASAASVRQAFEAITRQGSIDVLINNVGIYEKFEIVDATDEQIFGAIGANLIGPILCSRAAIPAMVAGSHIINVSSESVDLPYPQLAIYQSSKAGLERFSRSLYQELEPRGIRVTTVRAGAMFDEAMLGGAALPQGFAITDVDNVTGMFRAVIDMPADLTAEMVILHARRQVS